jgi:hypothetical protein
MHDIDSTRLEATPEYEQGENETFELRESQESEGEASYEMPMSETEEEALAAELLGVASEEEMEQFLGGLFRTIKKRLGDAAQYLSQNAGPLATALKGIAAKSLPFLTGALGTAIPIPGVGTALGTAIGKAASGFLQSELESMEAEEQEFEMARRYVRLASQAIRHAGRIPPRPNRSLASQLALRNAFRRLRARGGYRSSPRYSRYANSNRRGYQGYNPGYSGYADYSGYNGYSNYNNNAGPEACPPCPACPTCAQPIAPPPTGDTPAVPAVDATPAVNTSPAPDPTKTEFESEEGGEFENFGEYEGEGETESGEFGESENYETEGESGGYGGFRTRRRRGGRWVRRGRKIILYGL